MWIPVAWEENQSCTTLKTEAGANGAHGAPAPDRVEPVFRSVLEDVITQGKTRSKKRMGNSESYSLSVQRMEAVIASGYQKSGSFAAHRLVHLLWEI